ncbi:iron reductase domain protein [Cadophora sp. DSE1049]|nr:iron reductase domain protein [Cadophora sp. DSE1049]
MVRLSFLELATVASVFISTTTAVDTTVGTKFNAKDRSINFALNIPQGDDNNDLYFTIQAPSVSTWIAIGLGSDKMEDSLMFMAYSDSTGKNVTLSPRLSYGHVEPSYTKNVTVEVLPGTKIENGNYTVNALCRNCRSWKGGSIDSTNTAAKFNYATGPGGNLKSNSKSAGIKRHDLYGAFTMDLTKAVGVKGVPVMQFADGTGTVQTEDDSDRDFAPPAHAVLMILAFVGMMPLAVMILRVLNSPKWHGVTQTASALVALIGTGVGIKAGMQYNRTKNFDSAHQIFGIIVIAAMIGQFVLGFLHHRMYKKTQTTTKLAPIHVWLGRVVIPAGIANGFVGFPLALNPKYNLALLACVLFVIVVAGPFAFWRFRRNINKKNALADEPTGYQAQPWVAAHNSGPSSDINLNQMDYQQRNHPPIYQESVQGRQFV